MAAPAYYLWDRNGRPISPALPVREYVDQLKIGYPQAAAANLFGWYADENHYQASFPQDHTPYSQTPWPVTPNPYPYVFATDIMHRTDLGLNCFVIFDYWLAEAKAGRTPWIKYIIWQGKNYDVRNSWQPKPNSDHYDHIHISFRTDYTDVSIGGWSVVPPGAEGAEMYCKYGDSNSNNVETLQWTLFDIFNVNLGTTGPNHNGIDRAYGNRVGAGLASVIGWSDSTVIIDGNTTASQKNYGPHEVSKLADLVAQKRAAETPGACDCDCGDCTGGITAEEATKIAEAISRATVAASVIVPPAPVAAPTDADCNNCP